MSLQLLFCRCYENSLPRGHPFLRLAGSQSGTHGAGSRRGRPPLLQPPTSPPVPPRIVISTAAEESEPPIHHPPSPPHHNPVSPDSDPAPRGNGAARKSRSHQFRLTPTRDHPTGRSWLTCGPGPPVRHMYRIGVRHDGVVVPKLDSLFSVVVGWAARISPLRSK